MKFEGLVKLHRRVLQSHPGLPTVGRLRAPPDEAVNLFLDVDEGLFHGSSRIGRDAGHSKEMNDGARSCTGNFKNSVFQRGGNRVRAF